MKTEGGYQIAKFKKLKLELKDKRFPDLIYSGIVEDPELAKKVEVFWDAKGNCPNPYRSDMRIKGTKWKLK